MGIAAFPVAPPPPPPPLDELRGASVVVVVVGDAVAVTASPPTSIGVASVLSTAIEAAPCNLLSTALVGNGVAVLALEILKPGGRPAGNRADGDSWADDWATGTLIVNAAAAAAGVADEEEGVDEAAVDVTTVSTAGIDFRFKLRHGLRAARRSSTTDRVRRAFLQRGHVD